MILPDLPIALSYQNNQVIQHFCHKHPQFDRSQAEQLFNDLLAWLWLSAYRRQQGKKTWLFGPLLILDELWHCFILHTRDYYGFCHTYFGNYLHHDVEPMGYEHHIEAEELADFLEDCFNYLGDAWVERYFAEFFSEIA